MADGAADGETEDEEEEEEEEPDAAAEAAEEEAIFRLALASLWTSQELKSHEQKNFGSPVGWALLILPLSSSHLIAFFFSFWVSIYYHA